jgi:hypothetical protein
MFSKWLSPFGEYNSMNGLREHCVNSSWSTLTGAILKRLQTCSTTCFELLCSRSWITACGIITMQLWALEVDSSPSLCIETIHHHVHRGFFVFHSSMKPVPSDSAECSKSVSPDSAWSSFGMFHNPEYNWAVLQLHQRYRHASSCYDLQQLSVGRMLFEWHQYMSERRSFCVSLSGYWVTSLLPRVPVNTMW